MPNHVHVILKGEAPATAKGTLANVIRGWSRVVGAAGLWERAPEPAVIPDTKRLLRHIRYVHLNPCRDGLAADPLSWPWSTHRGVIGAEYAPWADARRLAHETSMPRTDFVEWFHGYVSSDPCVAVRGTPLPAPVHAGTLPSVALGAVRDAVLAAAPLAGTATLRAGFVLLSAAHGFRDHGALSRALGITHQHVLRLSKAKNDALVSASALCLGDSRLRHHAGTVPRAKMFKF